jgi:hypothetical protein
MADASLVEHSLTALDRCDRCNAPARVRANLVTGDLLFCGHHAREAGYALTLKSVSIYDPEGFINGK